MGMAFRFMSGITSPQVVAEFRLKSANPLDKPSILFNYLQQESDREGFRQCVRLTRDIINQPAMDPYRGIEIQPGASVVSDAEIDAYIRQGVEKCLSPILHL